MIGSLFWCLLALSDPTRLFTFENGSYIALDSDSKVIVVAKDGTLLKNFGAHPALVPVQGVYPAEIVMYKIPTHQQPEQVKEYAFIGLDLGAAGKEILLVRQNGDSRTIGPFTPKTSIRWVIDDAEQTHSIVQTDLRTVVCSGPGTVREMFRKTEFEQLAKAAAEALRRSNYPISGLELDAILGAIRNPSDAETLLKIRTLLVAAIANSKNGVFSRGERDAIAEVLRLLQPPCEKSLT